ncbi:DUF2892 domain-containing protein [Candidatus Shapirobacteria bacterium]|nr:DUF2892 domain-containing protein [Candidatus Shapirobacteria bacterium]
MKTNEGLIDRIIRISIGSIFLVIGYFWFGGLSQIITLIIGAIISLTGLFGFCGLYTLLKINTCSKNQKPLTPTQTTSIIALFIGLITIGSFASVKITQNKFLEDFNKMNGSYKQALFLTGQSKRDEAKLNYDQWVIAFQNFSQKYSQYKPFVLRNDSQFSSDLDKVAIIIKDSQSGVYEGDLPQTHKKLEEVRPIFQEMFKRNGFSMLAITLTDFHDSMEKLIAAADAKNTADIISSYPETNGILIQVEEQLNDDSIKAIRKNLDDLLKLAQDNKVDELSKKAAEMKTSFVKVYLLKG